MISGVWANSNYDDENKTRDKLLHSIDEFAERAIQRIYGIVPASDHTQDLDSPFFKAMKRPNIDSFNFEGLDE